MHYPPTLTSEIALAFTLIFIIALTSNAASPSCTLPRLRKEIRDLNQTEWDAYVNGVNQLKRLGRFDQYVAIHQQWVQEAHNGVLFFAWHRRFLWTYETDLLAITGPALSGIPYFDPFMSYSVFDPRNPRFMGEAQGCVLTGPFRGWMSPEGRCLQHALSASSTSFVDPRAMAQLILSDASFSDFGSTYEFGQHADVHTAIGGQMVGLQWSPSDPLFYAHHGHVDQVWYRRQWADVGRLYWDYSGVHTPGGVGAVTLNTPVPPWQDPVGSIVDTFGTMCYDYQDAQQPAPGVSGTGALSRRDAGDDHAQFRLFNFSSMDPLHKCTPLSADRLAPMGIALEQAQSACDRVNKLIDDMNSQHSNNRSSSWIMPHQIPRQTHRAPSQWLMDNGQLPSPPMPGFGESNPAPFPQANTALRVRKSLTCLVLVTGVLAFMATI